MSNDKGTRFLAAPSPQSRTPSIFAPAPAHTGGIVDTWLTLWEAKRKTAAHNQLAELHRAKANELTAYGEMATAYIKTARTVHQLDELPDILALERAERQAARASGYAAIEQTRQTHEWRESFAVDEHAHKEALVAERRERELTEAKLATYVARRRLAYREKMAPEEEARWLERAEAASLERELGTAELRRALGDHLGESEKPPSEKEIATETLKKARTAAMANGDYATQQRCEAALKAFEETGG